MHIDVKLFAKGSETQISLCFLNSVFVVSASSIIVFLRCCRVLLGSYMSHPWEHSANLSLCPGM